MLVLAFLAAGLSTTSASAHTTGRQYSVVHLNKSNVSGARAQMNQAQMFIDPWVGNDHINNVIWIILPGGKWVEMGYRNGFDATNPCSCIAYQQYRGENIVGGYVRTTVLNTVPNGTNNTFEMKRVFSGGPPNNYHWQFRRNGTSVGISVSSTTGQGFRIDVGGELATGGNRSHDAVAATFTNNSLRYAQNGGTFKAWTGGHFHTITLPCGTSPHCMNANQVNNNRFDWNKP